MLISIRLRMGGPHYAQLVVGSPSYAQAGPGWYSLNAAGERGSPCKTAIHGFDSHRRLHFCAGFMFGKDGIIPQSALQRTQLAKLDQEAMEGM